jgi:hypothetical protein
MLILDATTDSLQAVLGSAVTTTEPSFYASYVDVTTSTYVPGENHGATTGTTDVELVAAPAASTQRQVKFLTVYNRDTASVTVTIKLDVSATDTILYRAVLAPNEILQYADGEGWSTLDSNGNRKAQLGIGVSALAASGGTITSGQASFAASNGIYFGVNGQTITARAENCEFVEPKGVVSSRAMGQGTFYLQRFRIDAPCIANAAYLALHISNSSSAGGSVSIYGALYTRTGSTWNSVITFTRGISYNSTLGTSYTNISGTRVWSLSLPATTLPPGDYAYGIGWSVVTGLTSGSYTYFLNRSAFAPTGSEFGAGNVTNPNYWGVYRVATSNAPSSIHVTDWTQTASAAGAQPWFMLNRTI